MRVNDEVLVLIVATVSKIATVLILATKLIDITDPISKPSPTSIEPYLALLTN